MTPTPRSELIEAALRLIEDQRAFINGELTCRAGETDRQCINRSKAEMLQRAIDVTATLATPSAVGAPVVEGCHADHDGDCTHKDCPQLRDGEPRKSHRSCPLLVPIPPAPVGIAEVERLILDYVNAHMRAVNTKGVQAPAAKEALDALLDSITRFAGGKDGETQETLIRTARLLITLYRGAAYKLRQYDIMAPIAEIEWFREHERYTRPWLAVAARQLKIRGSDCPHPENNEWLEKLEALAAISTNGEAA